MAPKIEWPLASFISTRTVSHPIYGRIPPLQAVDAGQYSDTVVVTLTF